MIHLELTAPKGLGKDTVHLFLSKNHPFVVHSYDGFTIIKDGLHNNGGWRVFETVEEVLAMIEEQGS